MEKPEISENDLEALCNTARKLIGIQAYQQCEGMLCDAMGKYPHAPQPHNLIGILLEKTGDHLAAMKHFRAAWALDPTYTPARQNLECYGTFFSSGRCAYDESDCPSEDEHRSPGNFKIMYDAHRIGHVVGRRK